MVYLANSNDIQSYFMLFKVFKILFKEIEIIATKIILTIYLLQVWVQCVI